MARVSTYLNFNGNTEEAFNFYKSVFGTEFDGPIIRMGDGPAQENQPPMTDEQKKMVMHVNLPIATGHRLMGTDAPESMGFTLVMGNNIYINLELDSREEADKLYAALSEKGEIEVPLKEEFWGYFGSFSDKYGVKWMINVDKVNE